jgi:hypothetical protein
VTTKILAVAGLILSSAMVHAEPSEYEYDNPDMKIASGNDAPIQVKINP